MANINSFISPSLSRMESSAWNLGHLRQVFLPLVCQVAHIYDLMCNSVSVVTIKPDRIVNQYTVALATT